MTPYTLTNEELVQAIRYSSDSAYSSSGDRATLFLNHLERLLQIQHERAKADQVTTEASNALAE